MQLNKSVIILIVLSVLLNIIFGTLWYLSLRDLKNTQRQLVAQEAGKKTLLFAKMFVDKFLLNTGVVVGFDDRLALENAVRDINDQEIYKQWQNFTNSADDGQAQLSAGKLLNLLFARLEKR